MTLAMAVAVNDEINNLMSYLFKKEKNRPLSFVVRSIHLNREARQFDFEALRYA